MYGWIWRHLPGNAWVKALISLVLVAGRGLRALPVRLPVGRAAAALQRCDGGQDPVSARILVVDNYDSFVFNLVQYLVPARRRVRGAAQRRGVDARTRRTASTACCCRPAPARPRRPASASTWSAHCADTGVPVFGVCLGMQSIAVAYGGVVDRAPGAAARQDLAGGARGRGRLRRAAVPVHRDPLPLAGRRAGHRPGRARGHRPHRRRHHHGRCGTANCRSRACSSTPSRC